MTFYTTKHVISLLERLGCTPKKSLSQNFLINPDICQKIIQQVHASNAQNIIEVGPGLGSLTEGLKDQSNLILIEKDKIFAEFLKQKGFVVISQDALHVHWSNLIKDQTVLVSNLPYQISSRLLIERSLDKNKLEQMILMFQKEVALRIFAKTSTKAYGLLSVMAQTHWHITKILNAGPKDFYPVPQVGSQVLKFIRKPLYELNSQQFLNFLKIGFAQRRKQLQKLIVSFYPKIQPYSIQKLFKDLQIPQIARPEELSQQKWLELFKTLSSQTHS